MPNAPEAIVQPGILVTGETVAESIYEIEGYLGGGNSGEVYRLRHPKHGHNRVLKLFIPFYELRQAQLGQEERGELTNQIIEKARNQPYQQREYAFLSLLDHPFIVKVHDFGIQSLSAAQVSRLRSVTGDSFSGTSVGLPYIIGKRSGGVMREIARESTTARVGYARIGVWLAYRFDSD